MNISSTVNLHNKKSLAISAGLVCLVLGLYGKTLGYGYVNFDDDKYIVKEPSTEDMVDWGEYNRPITEEKFNSIYARLLAFVLTVSCDSRRAKRIGR